MNIVSFEQHPFILDQSSQIGFIKMGAFFIKKNRTTIDRNPR